MAHTKATAAPAPPAPPPAAAATPAAHEEPATIVIAGGGIVGLVFAMAVKKHCNLNVEIYEKAHQFYDDVGAALGMYPNGLRVLRDISPELLDSIHRAGHPYVYRRWCRHDGTEIATANEHELTGGDWDLSSIGIRRWKLQKVLFEHATKVMGIPFYFNKTVSNVNVLEGGEGGENELVQVDFEDGSYRQTQLLFGCDGAHSGVRNSVAADATTLRYTGVTCLMGISNLPSKVTGISFPSSHTTNCHSVYFPTGRNEQCFQVHWPIPTKEANSGNWGNLSDAMSKQECEELAIRLKNDGWAERYIEPLYHVTHAVRVGFALMEPRLKKWSFGKNRRIVLVGDAAHPPVPYIGQGAQMGLEDAGTMAWLLKELCIDYRGNLDLSNYETAIDLYESIRIPRTGEILDCSKQLGDIEVQRGGDDEIARQELELMIQGELMMNGTLPIMFQGASHNYRHSVERAIKAVRHAEELDAMNYLIPGAADIVSSEKQYVAKRNEEEELAAFEMLMYGDQ